VDAIDDYFYPYKEKDKGGVIIPFPDDNTWKKYQDGSGKLTRDDWRRDAVNRFIARMYKEVKAAKGWVKVGISPFGIWRPGNPAGIAGFDQYAELYADAKFWFNEGWMDYYSPQLYWPIAQEKQSFPKLLDWWAGENKKQRHLWPGLYTSRVTGAAKSWPAQEVVDQIEITRKQPAGSGVIHFSMRAFLKNTGGVADAVKKAYSEPALVPETAWLADGILPPPPTVTREVVDGKARFRVKGTEGTRFVVTRTLVGDIWKTDLRGVDASGEFSLPMPPSHVVFSVIDRVGRESERLLAPN
jgi:uncharacterized lipoprotein YddW (UPF0748 family)